MFDLDDTICTYRRDQDELLAVAFDRLDVEPFFDGRTYLDRYDEFVEESDDVRTCGNAVSQPSRWSRIVIPHSAGNSPGTMQMSALTATSAFVPGRRPRSIGSNDGIGSQSSRTADPRCNVPNSRGSGSRVDSRPSPSDTRSNER